MRLGKGSKVEVLNHNDIPSGSWRCAEIINGNGRYYNVKYESCLGKTNEAVVERVSRKAIRPCPPVLRVERWMNGHIAEVFYDSFWKIAIVLKALSKDYYLVKLLGSSQEHTAHKSDIRMRQSWQGDNWVLIGKGSKTFEGVKCSRMSSLKCHQRGIQMPQENTERKFGAADDLSAAQYNTDLQESRIVSSRTLKRGSPYCSSLFEACRGHVEKRRVIEEGRCQQVAQASELGKNWVDAIAYPQNLGKKYMHASFSNGTTGYYEMERENLNTVECPRGISSESNDLDSDACSVGSCSTVSGRTNDLPDHFVSGRGQQTHVPSDAESYYELGNEEENCPLSPKEDLEEKIHRLELHAYRSTLEAFYASGALSWEQEALLTNLRLSLHISNDEHLNELRTLGSTRISLHIS